MSGLSVVLSECRVRPSSNTMAEIKPRFISKQAGLELDHPDSKRKAATSHIYAHKKHVQLIRNAAGRALSDVLWKSVLCLSN